MNPPKKRGSKKTGQIPESYFFLLNICSLPTEIISFQTQEAKPVFSVSAFYERTFVLNLSEGLSLKNSNKKSLREINEGQIRTIQMKKKRTT